MCNAVVLSSWNDVPRPAGPRSVLAGVAPRSRRPVRLYKTTDQPHQIYKVDASYQMSSGISARGVTKGCLSQGVVSMKVLGGKERVQQGRRF